jgi:hypothetical protein
MNSLKLLSRKVATRSVSSASTALGPDAASHLHLLEQRMLHLEQVCLKQADKLGLLYEIRSAPIKGSRQT